MVRAYNRAAFVCSQLPQVNKLENMLQKSSSRIARMYERPVGLYELDAEM